LNLVLGWKLLQAQDQVDYSLLFHTTDFMIDIPSPFFENLEN